MVSLPHFAAQPDEAVRSATPVGSNPPPSARDLRPPSTRAADHKFASSQTRKQRVLPLLISPDRIMLDTKTPDGTPQGGGFGPTVQLDDGILVTSYSYRGEDGKSHLEVVRWELPKSR